MNEKLKKWIKKIIVAIGIFFSGIVSILLFRSKRERVHNNRITTTDNKAEQFDNSERIGRIEKATESTNRILKEVRKRKRRTSKRDRKRKEKKENLN